MQYRQSRQLELVRRIIIYLLMITTVITLLVVFTLTVVGYRFNFATRTVEQTGLVQYDSYPRGALVAVDGNNYETTQSKGTVLPGQRQFSMKLKGYEDWQKTMEIRSGTVTWLSYARLVPIARESSAVEVMPELTDTLVSPDSRFMIGVSVVTGQPEIVLIDFRDSQRPKVQSYPIDTTSLAGYAHENPEAVSHNFSISEWSDGSRYVLLKHSYNLPDEPEKTEWVWLDRESPADIINVSTLLNLPISDIHLADGRNIYILQENGDIRRASVNDGNITRPLISNVSQFELYSNSTIAYLGQGEDARLAGVWRRDWEQPVVLATEPLVSEDVLRISASKYFNEDTVVISRGESVSIYRGSLPTSQQAKEIFMKSPKKFTLNRPVDNLQISDSGRFVVAEDFDGFVSYDLEHMSVSQETKKYNKSPIGWLTNYHIWQVDDNGYLVMQEFDGMNGHDMMPADVRYDAILTRDNKYMYSLVVGESGELELRQLSMVIGG